MQNGDGGREETERFPDAPNVGAFYFEDAADVITRSGYRIGRIEITRAPRRPYGTSADAGTGADVGIDAGAGTGADAGTGIDAGAGTGADVGIDAGIDVAAISDIPHGKYRVVRYNISRSAHSDEPSYNLLITKSK